MATVPKSNMGPTKAVPTPFGCIGCKLPKPDYPPALITFMFCAMVVTVILDLVGNSMVILAVIKNKKLRNSGKPSSFSLPGESPLPNFSQTPRGRAVGMTFSRVPLNFELHSAGGAQEISVGQSNAKPRFVR